MLLVRSGLSLRKTTVEEAMTPNPLCVREHERADKALALMVEKRARHLPLLDAQGGLSGMLDIAKVLYDAITRLERSKDANDSTMFPALNRFVGLGETTVPTLAEALRERPPPATANPSDPIEVAFAGLRRTRRSVLVLDEVGKLVGILSKSDVAKRALRTALSVDARDDAAELKALKRLRVRDVMTPRPDYIVSTRTVLDALHKMHDGKYANMPILDPVTDEPIGCVDVLDLLRSAIGGPSSSQPRMSLLEGFFAAPRSASIDADDQPRLTDSTRAATASTVDVEDQEVVPIATAVELSASEQLPRRDNVSCAIAPSTLKHSKGTASGSTLVDDFNYELVFAPNRRCSVSGLSDYNALRTIALARLGQQGALDVHFDYADSLARLRVVNDDTLRVATQLCLAIDPAATLVPLSVVVEHKRNGIGALANLLLATAIAAVIAFAVTKSQPRP